MKKVWGVFGAGAALMMLLSGCQSEVLNTGLYLADNGGEEYAVVYEELIFLHVRRPERMTGNALYWDWAGKYKINDSRELEFDMKAKEKKDWDFYYVFRPDDAGSIVLEDLSRNSRSTVLKRRPEKNRRGGQMPMNNY